MGQVYLSSIYAGRPCCPDHVSVLLSSLKLWSGEPDLILVKWVKISAVQLPDSLTLGKKFDLFNVWFSMDTMGVGWGVIVVIFENCCGNSLKQSMRGSGFSFPAINFSGSINNCYHFHLHEDVKLSLRYQSRSCFLDLGVPKMMDARTTRSS